MCMLIFVRLSSVSFISLRKWEAEVSSILWDRDVAPTTKTRIYHAIAKSTINICSRNMVFNPLNAELNPICHLMALLGSHRILHVSRIRVKSKKNGSKTEFHRNGLLATLSSNFQEGQN